MFSKERINSTIHHSLIHRRAKTPRLQSLLDNKLESESFLCLIRFTNRSPFKNKPCQKLQYFICYYNTTPAVESPSKAQLNILVSLYDSFKTHHAENTLQLQVSWHKSYKLKQITIFIQVSQHIHVSPNKTVIWFISQVIRHWFTVKSLDATTVCFGLMWKAVHGVNVSNLKVM